MNINEHLLEQAEKNRFPVALYGAGKYGRIALANITGKYPHIPVVCFIDDDLARNNSRVENLEVVSPGQAVSAYGEGELIIVISNYYIRETMVRLQKAGIDLQSVYFSNELLIEPVAIDYIQEKADELSQVYDLLADYESRMIYKTLIECRVTRNIDLLGRTCRDSQYFEPDIVRFGEHEIFVDAGAFDDDTIDHFLKLVKGKYRYIYAFEPDKKNYENLKAGHRHENIYLYNMGLYSEEQEVSFLSGKGGSSQVYPDGEDVIKVCGFDRLDVPDRKVSFVKMDIEGSELNALRGMAETISRYRPALAICIYHKFEDLWEIPLFIHQLVPQYQLYIRNYTTYLDEIVLYAVAPDAEYTAKGETE